MMDRHAYACCDLCPRHCRVDRTTGETGFCGMPDRPVAARAALHMWEEPCISGSRGSGAVFFSGCALRCVYCQNYQIAAGDSGRYVSSDRLTEIFLELESQGAANINLVTATHFLPDIVPALYEAKERGLSIPILYNSSGYETVETVTALSGLVDVWLPDFKYAQPELAARFSRAADYPQTAAAAIEKMLSLAGRCEYDPEGYIQKGVIIRHLVLPGHTRNSIAVLDELAERFGSGCSVSIMSQYTPVRECDQAPELNRRLTAREYEKVLDHALALGFTEGFFQEGGVAEESFIPAFDYEGL